MIFVTGSFRQSHLTDCHLISWPLSITEQWVRAWSTNRPLMSTDCPLARHITTIRPSALSTGCRGRIMTGARDSPIILKSLSNHNRVALQFSHCPLRATLPITRHLARLFTVFGFLAPISESNFRGLTWHVMNATTTATMTTTMTIQLEHCTR